MPELNQLLGNLAAPLLERVSRPARQVGRLSMPELYAPVEVARDAWGIPHIFAANPHDLFFAQGFVHAQDRFFQMEFNRRLVAGQLSEVLGEISLPVDRWIRTLTMRRVAEFEFGMLSDNGRRLLGAYARGVNACLRLEPLPVEFTLLRYKPAPWRIVDTLAWVKMMAWTLSVNWETEIIRARLIDRLGPEAARQLDPDYPDSMPTVIPRGVDFSAVGTSALERAAATRPFSGPSPYQGVGSNNWVISGARTTTGMPLLANDMHLSLTIPAIWYENHLNAPDLQFTGVTFPGIPGVVSGHNGHVAWGYTNGFPDVQDLFMEHLRRTASGGVEAEYNGAWEPARLLREVIQVKGKPPVVHEIIVTRHGPVINELSPDLAGETPLALCWTALEPNNMIECLLEDLLSAKNCAEFHAGLEHWHTPSQNVVYADVEGNIGYTLSGRVPIRKNGDGQVPVPGWTDEYEWVGYIPYAEMPHLMNPPEGYIASANNRVVGPGYPHFLGRETVSGDRAQRIHELIQSQEKISPEFIRTMHFDLVCPSARRLRELVCGLPISDPELVPLLEMLRAWDGSLHPESAPAAVYEVFYRQMIGNLLSSRLDEFVIKPFDDGKGISAERFRLSQHYMGKGPTPILMESSLMGMRALEWLLALLEDEESGWYDLGGGQGRTAAVRAALADTLAYLRMELGPRPEDWAWGKLHHLMLIHSLGSLEALAPFLNRGPFPLGGDHNTVWATGTFLHQPTGDRSVGPPYRMIVDLGNLANSRAILMPGQSGRPATEHYADQIGDWFAGSYHPMYFPQEVPRGDEYQLLQLVPDPGSGARG